MQYSKKRAIWRAFIKPTICQECYSRNGRIYSYYELILTGEPGRTHPNCRCCLKKMQAIEAGTATELGINGADWWIKYLNELPSYYISRSEAKQAGWNPFYGNLQEVLPGYMIFGGIYKK